jgi:hypothetical protein
MMLTPSTYASLEQAMRVIKDGTSHEIIRVRRSKLQVWQSDFHEFRVTVPVDWKNKMGYIRCNPVAARPAEWQEDWRLGSARPNFKLAPMPQGPKPSDAAGRGVGPEGPPPNSLTDKDAQS